MNPAIDAALMKISVVALLFSNGSDKAGVRRSSEYFYYLMCRGSRVASRFFYPGLHRFASLQRRQNEFAVRGYLDGDRYDIDPVIGSSHRGRTTFVIDRAATAGMRRQARASPDR
jgi:hypothetical protein